MDVDSPDKESVGAWSKKDLDILGSDEQDTSEEEMSDLEKQVSQEEPDEDSPDEGAGETVEEDAEDGEDTAAKPKRSAQERINELTRNWREEQRRREALEQQMQQFQMVQQQAQQGQAEPERQGDPKPPRRYDFDSDEKFDEAMASWMLEEADRRAERKIQQVEQKYQQSEQQNQVQKAFSSFREEAERFKEQVPDYEEVTNQDFPVNEVMTEAILNADNGPAVYYHLGKNPDEAARISGMSPQKAFIEIGRLDARLAKEPQRSTRAPDPPKTVSGGRGGAKKDPSKVSFKEFERLFERGEI